MRDRLRVLWLIKGLGAGGAERLLEQSIPYLDRQRFEYQVAYLLPWKDALVPSFERASIPVHCLGFRRNFDAMVLRRLQRLLQRNRIDLVHAHLPVPGFLSRVARVGTGVKWVVYTEHNLPSRYTMMTRIVNAVTYPMNNVVIAVSQAVAEQVQQYQRQGRPRLVTILNGVELDGVEAANRDDVCRQFGFPADARLIVNVANLVHKKGHRHLLAAAKRVLAVEPRARFLLVGSGPLLEDVSREAQRLNLNGQVVLTGFREDAASLIGAADVFVLASVHEGLPVSLLEAMALARPVVATRVGGIPELISDETTGVLVNPTDERSLAAELISLLGDPERRHRLGESGRLRVRQGFGIAQMVAGVENEYQQLMQRGQQV